MSLAAAVAGVASAAYGLYALTAIPRGPDTFNYQPPPGGNAFWPLPYAPLNGFTPEQLASHGVRLVFLLPACLLLGFACRHLRRCRLPKLGPIAAVAIATSLTIAIAIFVIRGVPLQDDDATYLMQADLLTRGLVADPAYSFADDFVEPFTIFTRAGMSGMYLFGTPLVLAAGLPWHMPWLGQALLVALTVWCAYLAATRTGDREVALYGTLLLAVSPMLTFTSATFLSQTPALAGVTVAVLGITLKDWRGGTLVGTGLGFAFAARPQVAGPVGAVLALYAWRDRRLLVAAALSGLPWIAAVAAYDYRVTGDPFHLPRFAYMGELEAYGFGNVLRHYVHTPLKAAALAAVVLGRLNGWSLGWPLSLAGPALWLARGRPQRGIVGPWAAIALVTFLYQAGYPSIGTSETGALYHYAALPFIAYSTAAALRDVAALEWGGWAQAVAVTSLLIGTTSFYAEHGYRLSRLSTAIEGPRRSLDVAHPALILEEVWGGRPQAGWVFGIPFRERSPSAPVVRFPRPNRAAELQHLTARWKDRHCYYLGYDWAASQYRLDPCSDMVAH